MFGTCIDNGIAPRGCGEEKTIALTRFSSPLTTVTATWPSGDQRGIAEFEFRADLLGGVVQVLSLRPNGGTLGLERLREQGGLTVVANNDWQLNPSLTFTAPASVMVTGTLDLARTANGQAVVRGGFFDVAFQDQGACD